MLRLKIYVSLSDNYIVFFSSMSSAGFILLELRESTNICNIKLTRKFGPGKLWFVKHAV